MLESQDAEITEQDVRSMAVMAVMYAYDIITERTKAEPPLVALRKAALEMMSKMHFPEEEREKVLDAVLNTPLVEWLLPGASAPLLGKTVVDYNEEAGRAARHQWENEPSPIKSIFVHHTDGEQVPAPYEGFWGDIEEMAVLLRKRDAALAAGTLFVSDDELPAYIERLHFEQTGKRVKVIIHHTDGGLTPDTDNCPECDQPAPGGMCMFCGWGTEEE